MIKIAVNGALGRMGRRISNIVIKDERCHLVGALEHVDNPQLGKSLGNFIELPCKTEVTTEIPEDTQVLIDFSLPPGLEGRIPECMEKKIALVSGTTGLTESQLAKLREAAQVIPVLHGTNMSLGVNLLRRLVRQAAQSLGDDFDIEIVELHHHHKIDAPSGTALTLYEDICETLDRDPKDTAVHGREGKTGKRSRKEIGLHALRLGDVVGEHTVYFCNEGEKIELKHTAHTRDAFAQGAVHAARWIAGKPVGLYSMENVLFG